MIDELPQGWMTARISDLGTTQSGGTPSTAKREYWDDGDIPWTNSGALKDAIISAPSTFITKLGLENSSAKLFPRKTVVIALTGATTGRVGLLELETSTNQSVTGIFPSPVFVSEYIFYYLRWARDAVLERAIGSAQPHINKRIVDELEVPVAPLNEQRRIVAKLEKLLGKVDSCQQRLAKIRALLKRFRQSVLAAACSGRLTADWRKENGSELSAWRESALKELLAQPLANGRSVPDAENGFPVLRLTCLKNGRIDLGERKTGAWTAETARRFLVARGDFFVSRGNGSRSLVGRGGLVESQPDPVAFPDTLIRIRVRREDMAAEFLSLVWNAKPIRDQIEAGAHTTAGIWKISQGDLESFLLPTPPLAEQQEIVRRVEDLFALADQIEARYAKAAAHVEKLTHSILAKAFRGELVPQDPNDEPASVLLERIRQRANANESSKRKTKRVALATI